MTSALFANNATIAGRIFGLRFGETSRRRAPATSRSSTTTRPRRWTQRTLLGHVVFGLSQAAVDTTIVGGRVLMENRKLTLNLDEERVNARARELARNLWKRM